MHLHTRCKAGLCKRSCKLTFTCDAHVSKSNQQPMHRTNPPSNIFGLLGRDISTFASKPQHTMVTSDVCVLSWVFIPCNSAGSLPPKGPILLVMAYRRMRSSLTYITNMRSILSSCVSSLLGCPWLQSLYVMFCLTWKVKVSAPFSADTIVNSRTDEEVITENKKKEKSLEESNSQQTLAFYSRRHNPTGFDC